jgi:hypothetical protein
MRMNLGFCSNGRCARDCAEKPNLSRAAAKRSWFLGEIATHKIAVRAMVAVVVDRHSADDQVLNLLLAEEFQKIEEVGQ